MPTCRSAWPARVMRSPATGLLKSFMKAREATGSGFDDNLRWRHQTAYMVNNHLLLPTLNFYAFAIAKAPSWNETVHAEIGEWLAQVVADSDEYMYYGFGYYEGPLWHEIKSITNHVTMQGAVRMAYGILWNDPERVVEGLNLYKYRLETVREDASMASETRRGSMALNYRTRALPTSS